MNILFGIAASGNGHIERARIMVPLLEAEGAKVTCLLSGDFHGKELDFGQSGGDTICRKGFKIHNNDGEVKVGKTALGMAAALPAALIDAKKLDMANYDLVITDFDPISAFAAQMKGVTSIGLAHQFALKCSDVPNPSPNSPYMMCMRRIVPVDIELGLHWHPYGENILPPIIKEIPDTVENDPKKIVVYLNFDSVKNIHSTLKLFSDYDFHVYSKRVNESYDDGNLHFNPISEKFKTDFSNCSGVITGAGFMSTSEALQMGKRVLVKPMQGQTEQQSNALALTELNLGATMNSLNPKKIKAWLENDQYQTVNFPDTARLITSWIGEQKLDSVTELSKTAWSQSIYEVSYAH